jgi:Antitoxin VbhA
LEEVTVMTVSQTNEIQWEPEGRPESVADAIASLRVDGLEPTPFGAAVMQRVAGGEIDTDEAVAELLVHHRA